MSQAGIVPGTTDRLHAAATGNPSFDPPNHTAHQLPPRRALITPKRLKENEDFMWRFADQLIDSFLEEESCEMVASYCIRAVHPHRHRRPGGRAGVRPLPLPGAPVDGARDVGHKPLEFLYDRFNDCIEDKRVRRARNDVLTGLATATFPDGSTPEAKSAALIAANLFAGGRGDDRPAPLFALRMLGERPDLQDIAARRRDKIPNFIEETLRLEAHSEPNSA